MLAVDTNVLVYAADVDSPHHGACRDWLERRRARPDARYTTWPILYQFLPVPTHPRVMRRPWRMQSAWGFVKRSWPRQDSACLRRRPVTKMSPAK